MATFPSGNCIAFWNFEEAEGIREDAIGNADLVPGGPKRIEGITSGHYGVKLRDDDSYLYRSSNGLYPNGDFSISAWFNPNQVDTNQTIAGIWGLATNNDKVYRLRLNCNGANQYFEFDISVNGSSQYTNTHSGVEVDKDEWYHVVGTYHHYQTYPGSGNTLVGWSYIYVNGNYGGSTYVYGSVSGDMINQNSTESFQVGAHQDRGACAEGVIDGVGYWDDELDGGEISGLYNGGVGTFPE